MLRESAVMALLLPDLIMVFVKLGTKALPIDNFFAAFYTVAAIGK